jgi:hypothetical protein
MGLFDRRHDEAVSRGGVGKVDFDRIAEWITGLFPARSYPAAFIGSSNGALVHIAASLGVPWLPQTFLCPVRSLRSDPDDARAGFIKGQAIVDSILRAQPNVSVHHMHDPNQDRLMLKTMSYFRLKHRALPRAYRDFLDRVLPRGGTLYIDECAKRWPVTRTSERSVFQFGAVGGLEAEEYFRGSERVRDYLARYHVDRVRWAPPDPNDTSPEAEWGFDAALHEDVAAVAESRGWRLVRIRFEDPEALSPFAAAIHRAWYRDLAPEPQRLIVDSFVLMDPYRTIRLRALPFWLLFCVERSASVLEAFLDQEAPFDEIGLMLFSHGTEGVGMVDIGRWRRILSRARKRGYFLGVDERRYPRDFATFIRFHQALAASGLPFDLPPPLPLERFERMLVQHGPRLGIRITQPTGFSPRSDLATGIPH